MQNKNEKIIETQTIIDNSQLIEGEVQSSFIDNGIVSMEKNLWLKKILNTTQKYIFIDQEQLSFPYRFGPDFVPNPVTLQQLVEDIRVKDLVWVPLSVAWSAGMAHWKYRIFIYSPIR